MTPAIVAARRAQIPFSVHDYVHDSASGSYGLEAAEKLGVEPARVFKTLAVAVDERSVIAVVPVTHSLSLKALASAVGGKRASMMELSQAERVTGYVAGGMSPLGQKKTFPTVVDEGALRWETIFVSAGRRGLEIELSPDDLVRLLNARIAAIVS